MARVAMFSHTFHAALHRGMSSSALSEMVSAVGVLVAVVVSSDLRVRAQRKLLNELG